MQARVAPCFRSLMILLNNFLARFSVVILEGTVSMADVSDAAAVAAIAEKDLASLQPFNPDVLDTRATYMLAVGRFDEALELSSSAVAARPGNPQLRLTLAKAMLAMGRSEAATEEATVAIQLERLKPYVDSKLIQELQQIRDSN